ncbi:hypothetical protein ACLMJK_000916 [Lecanora helva]
MSGIEVAGVLLAVIPFFISAAEHYREGLDAGKRCWNKDRILRQYRVELEFQRVYLVLNLKALLVDVDLDFAVKEALLGGSEADPESSKTTYVPALNEVWERPSVKAELVKRLGEAHGSFVSLLQRVSQALIGQIKKHDALHDQANIKESSPANCSVRLRAFHDKIKSSAGLLDGQALWQCIKFSWQESERNQMIIDLQDNYNKLQTLLRMLQAVKPFHAEQRSSHLIDMFSVRQREVCRMHRVLSQYCRCSHPGHEAKLSLRRSHYEQKLLDDLCFETILYRTPSTPRPVRIHITPLTTQKETRRVKVNVAGSDDHHALNRKQRQTLSDICFALSTPEAAGLCFDLSIDEKGILWQYAIPQSRPTEAPGQFYTLDTLLGAASHYRKEPKWLAKEKGILAVILCHSLMHLEGSQWLQKGWCAQTISLVQGQELALARNPRFSLNQPYISSDIVNNEASLITNAQDLALSEPSGHPIPSLMNLGVILLELYLNGPLESAVEVEPVANLQLWAMSVLGSCRDDKDMEPSYYNAIQFCIWPPLPRTGICSFENATFCADYHRKVVVPLEDALTEGFDFSKEDLALL